MATHDEKIVNKFKKRVIVIKEGRIAKDYEEGKYDHEAI
jgi:ABC-type ATPase involved in cell division